MPNALQNNSILNNIKSESIRCGEIYCHSASEFTIHCEFCELKSTDYEIFLLHFNLMHSDNILLQYEENDEENISLVDVNEVYIEAQNSEESFATETSQTAKSQLKDECLPNQEKGGKVGKDITGTWADSNKKNTCDQFSLNEEIKTKRTRKERTCEYCGKVYKNNTYLKNHITLEHETNEPSCPVKCRECSEEFSNNHLLNKHCMDEHNGIKCLYCHRKFKRRTDLMRHTAEKHTHCNDAKFVCDYENCSKRFYTKSNLKSHQSFHNKPKNFVCDVCAFSCQGGNTLRSHYRTHLDERPYACSVCNAKFKRKHQLDRHIDIHNRDEKSFFCDFEQCTKSFFTGRQLDDHKRRHTMLKKYVCDVCSYSTKHKQSLQIHYRKHTAEEPEHKIKA